MGWYSDENPGHEGYLVGLVELHGHKGSGLYRALTIDDSKERKLEWVAVGCDCGWRSPRLFAPYGTVWIPHIVMLAADRDHCVIEAYEESARKLWRAHIAEIARYGVPRLRCDPDDLQAAIDRAVRRDSAAVRGAR